MTKKTRLIPPTKLSINQIRKQYKKLVEENKNIKNLRQKDFQLTLLLAINLYKLNPNHPLFETDKFFNENFIKTVKDSVESMNKQAEKLVQGPVEESKSEAIITPVEEKRDVS